MSFRNFVFSRPVRAACALFAFLGIAGTAHAETWHRADTHHFTIYSDGSTSQLEDFAHEAEKFDALLRMIFGKPASDHPTKLNIYLLRNSNEVSQYSSNSAGFYVVRLGETFAVANREGGSSRHLTGKTALFHEYAHHFLYHNFNVAAPAWYSEGFAEFVSTAEFERDGEWTFGVPAHHRAYSIQALPPTPIEKLLSQDYSKMDGAETAAFYGWAWALTHMLYSDPETGAPISRYLDDIANGMDSISSAKKNFGDLDKLERRMRSYVRGKMGYKKSPKPFPYRDSVSITTLDDTASELRGLTLDRLAGRQPERTRDKLLRLATSTNSAQAWLELAELQFNLDHKGVEAKTMPDFTATTNALDRAIALDPKLARAQVLKGRLLMEPFDHLEDADTENWAKARAYFVAANQLDSKDPLALYFYAQTFQRSGEPGEMVGPALEDAFMYRPESPEFRSALATHYADEKRYDDAILLLKVIANNPHSDNKSAKEAIAKLEEARDNGGTLAPDAIVIESDEDVDGEAGPAE